MNTRLKLLVSFTLCALLSGTALARTNGRDRDRDRTGPARHNVVRQHRDRDGDHDRWRDRRERREARDRQWRRDHRRDAFVGNNGQPHGWSQGRKTGWRNCDLPPGQAKKYGCSSTWRHTHRRRHGRDRDRDHDRD